MDKPRPRPLTPRLRAPLNDRSASRIVTLMLVIGLILFALATIVVTLLVFRAQTTAAVHDMRGNVVTMDEDQQTTPDQIKQMNPVPSTGETIAIPSVKLEVPVGELSEVDGQLTPPDFTQFYRDRDRGVGFDAASSGTVYLFAHSLRGGGDAPGNYLIDVKTQTSALKSGDVISVAGSNYVVESSELIDKKSLPAVENIWAPQPGRLILITCMQKLDGTPSTQNLVVTATRTAPTT